MSDLLPTETMRGIVKKVFRFEPFFLKMFFPMLITFDTESVKWDTISQSGKLAPFVSPLVAGKVNKKKGFVRKDFEPAYIKLLDNVRPALPMKQIAGESAGGTLTMAQRRMWWITHLLAEQEGAIKRREEWMAIQAVLTGTVLIEGEDYPSVLVDFGRSAENNITLAGALRWDTVDPETYDPSDDIEDWAMYANGPVNVCVMDKQAWRLFKRFKKVKDDLKTDSGSRTTMETGPKDLGMVASFKGTYGADLEIWVYKGQFEEEDGNYSDLIPPGTVILGFDGYHGVRAYGAIQDAQANAAGVIEAERHQKNYFTDNPSVENLLTQSAPIMVTEDPDGFVVISVLG